MIYLVDYENVNLYGMTGIEKLTPEDKVIVFLGNTMGAIPFEWHIRISDAPAKVKYIKCGKVCKNYLDFQLATYCGYLMPGLESGEVFIVSKDKGFDSVIDFWRDNKENVKISRVETIDESLGVVPEAVKQDKEEKPENQDYPERNQRLRRASLRGRGKRGHISRQNNAEDNGKEIKANTGNESGLEEKDAVIHDEAEESAVQESNDDTAKKQEVLDEAKEEINAPIQVEPSMPETEVKVQEAKESQPDRKGKLSEGIKKRIRLKVKDEELKGGSYKTIYNIFMNEHAKNRFNTALVKAFQQEKGNRIYKKLLPEFEEHLREQ